MGLFDNDNENGYNQNTMNKEQTPNGFLPAVAASPASGDGLSEAGRANDFFGNLNPVQHLMAVKTGLVTNVNGSAQTMQQAEGNGTGRAQSPDTVYDPDNRRDYDADGGGACPKGSSQTFSPWKAIRIGKREGDKFGSKPGMGSGQPYQSTKPKRYVASAGITPRKQPTGIKMGLFRVFRG